jgi:hypothetical protein
MGMHDTTMLDMSCPEFFVTDVGRIEYAGGGCVRIYACVRKGSHLEPLYTVVIPLENLVSNARTMMSIAADMHNDVTFYASGASAH